MISTVELQRKRVGLTQTELSNKIGISRRALSSIEKSTSVPSVDVALKIATVLNTSVEALFHVSNSAIRSKLAVPSPAVIAPSSNKKWRSFKFIDLFAGIGGIRLGFESVGGK